MYNMLGEEHAAFETELLKCFIVFKTMSFVPDIQYLVSCIKYLGNLV